MDKHKAQWTLAGIIFGAGTVSGVATAVLGMPIGSVLWVTPLLMIAAGFILIATAYKSVD